mgnify:FL=1
MDSVFEYMDLYGQLSFETLPFNEIDAVILARLSFIPFDDFVSPHFNESIPLGEACRKVDALPERTDNAFWPGDVKLMRSVIGRKRFAELPVSGYVNILHEEDESQFAAVCYTLPDDVRYLAYRGTDDNLVGWKENFNMSFTFPVPAQKSAALYFEKAAREMPSARFILGGHSKGGNLAIYAAAFCSEEARENILKIYNFDGPGFREKTLQRKGYRAVRSRIITYVPQSSIIGMILEQEGEYTIVHSENIGLLQHDIMSWACDLANLCFVPVESFTSRSRLFDHAFRRWLEAMSLEHREYFVDTIFAVMEETGAKTLTDFRENKFHNLRIILKTIRGQDEETRQLMRETFRMLFRSAKAEAARLISEKQSQRRQADSPGDLL